VGADPLVTAQKRSEEIKEQCKETQSLQDAITRVIPANHLRDVAKLTVRLQVSWRKIAIALIDQLKAKPPGTATTISLRESAFLGSENHLFKRPH
jgi:hypothetical protein